MFNRHNKPKPLRVTEIFKDGKPVTTKFKQINDNIRIGRNTYIVEADCLLDRGTYSELLVLAGIPEPLRINQEERRIHLVNSKTLTEVLEAKFIKEMAQEDTDTTIRKELKLYFFIGLGVAVIAVIVIASIILSNMG